MRVTLIAGRPQQGKTTLALALANREARRLLVLDPARSRVLGSVTTLTSWSKLALWLGTPGASADRWAVALRSKEPADYAETLRHLEYLRYCTVLVDEVLTFTSDPEAAPWLRKAARTSAHFGDGTGLNILMTAQRPGDIPPDVRATITRLCCFQTLEPADLEWIAKFSQDPSFAERVAGLAPHSYLTYPAASSQQEGSPSDEIVPDGRARRGRGSGAVPDRAQAEPHPEAPRRAQVSGS